jgi:hypothetical protein
MRAVLRTLLARGGEKCRGLRNRDGSLRASRAELRMKRGGLNLTGA